MTVKSLRKQLAAAIAMTLVATVALGSSTYAWFVNNAQVTANMNTISSSTVTPSLFINNGSSKDSQYKTEDSNTFTGTLYPSSSDDMENWFIARDWTSGTAGGTTTKEAQVSGFSLLGATADLANNVVAWTSATDGTYTTGGVVYNAFLETDYTFYTLNGDLDVYLAGSDAIKVDISQATIDANAATGVTAAQLVQALRIGFVDETGSLVYVYSPYAESGYGNTVNASAAADTFYTISGTTAAGATITAVTDSVYKIFNGGATGDTLNKYFATTTDGISFTRPTDDVKLTTATAAGKTIKVYVWLEGTDAQCRVGMADGVSGVNVSIDFAGIKPVPASEP